MKGSVRGTERSETMITCQSITPPSSYGGNGTSFTNNLKSKTQEREYLLGHRVRELRDLGMHSRTQNEPSQFDQVIERTLRAAQKGCKQHKGSLPGFAERLLPETYGSLDYHKAFSYDPNLAKRRIGTVGEAFVGCVPATATYLTPCLGEQANLVHRYAWLEPKELGKQRARAPSRYTAVPDVGTLDIEGIDGFRTQGLYW